jgi:maltokinase
MFDAVEAVSSPILVQRIHGDLHLGQTLRTVRGWKIVDFEGEPAKPLAERVLPDSPWRDVAGMLRSFDYAAHAVEADVQAELDDGAQIAYRANEWAMRNQRAFLTGYLTAIRPDEPRDDEHPPALAPDEQVLLTAYQVDKAVYETVYEARNRPSWIGIPLGAIERLTAATQEEAS